MKIKNTALAIALILASQPSFSKTSTTSTPQASTSIKTLESLSMAPDFSLQGQDGKTYSLKDYKGKIVVLEWFNNDCPYVEKHYGSNHMQKLQKKYADQGVVWFSISSTTFENAIKAEELAKIYIDRKSQAKSILIDSNGDMARAYGAKTTPHMFVINTEGTISYMGAIDNNDSFRKDTIKGAKNYVSDALDVLLSNDKTKTISVPQTKPYGCSVKIGI